MYVPGYPSYGLEYELGYSIRSDPSCRLYPYDHCPLGLDKMENDCVRSQYWGNVPVVVGTIGVVEEVVGVVPAVGVVPPDVHW